MQVSKSVFHSAVGRERLIPLAKERGIGEATAERLPKAGYKVNQVETWFSILQGQSLSGASFTAVSQLHFISPHRAWKNGSRVTSILGSPPGRRPTSKAKIHLIKYRANINCENEA